MEAKVSRILAGFALALAPGPARTANFAVDTTGCVVALVSATLELTNTILDRNRGRRSPSPARLADP